MAPLTIFCDFDGTITEVDTCEAILDKFSSEDWRKEDRLLEAGKITLEEALKRQLAPLRVTRSQMLSAVEDIGIRPGFREFVDYCAENKTELVVVSAGLDFVIKRKLEGINDRIQIVSPVSKLTPHGLEVTFPRLQGPGEDFKVQLLNAAKSRGRTVYYIGDGNSDFAAAAKAEFVFAIHGSDLASFCKAKGLSYTEVRDFFEVLTALKSHS